MSQSTIFQLCQDRSSWTWQELICLAQGHNSVPRNMKVNENLVLRNISHIKLNENFVPWNISHIKLNENLMSRDISHIKANENLVPWNISHIK